MKVGDLVKMKYEMGWSKNHVRGFGLVYDIAGKGLKVLLSDGIIKVGLIQHWEVVHEQEISRRSS